jgi:AraC-like DNA-binding protein
VLPRRALDLPNRKSDARLLATIEPLAEAALRAQPHVDDFAALAAARVRALLPLADVETTARALHMSPRTLQRRLAEAGTRFCDVLDSARAELARQLLGEEAVVMGDIAFRLGFADLGSFSRAFKRWTGRAPGAYRRAVTSGRGCGQR